MHFTYLYSFNLKHKWQGTRRERNQLISTDTSGRKKKWDKRKNTMEWNESVVFAFVFCSLLFLLLFTVDLCCVRSLPFITSGNKWAREWKEMEHNTPPFHSLFPLVYNGSEKEAWNKRKERDEWFVEWVVSEERKWTERALYLPLFILLFFLTQHSTLDKRDTLTLRYVPI